MQNHEHQGGSHEEHGHDHDDESPGAQKGEASYGWLWIVGIIIVVAVGLFFLQDNVPQNGDDAEGSEMADEMEDELAIRPLGVYDLSAPSSVSPGAFIGIDWTVSTEAEGTMVESTYIQWGTESMANLEVVTEDSYPNSTKEDVAEAVAIPAEFEATVKAPGSGIIYFRAMAMVDGALYWSEEKSITVKSK